MTLQYEREAVTLAQVMQDLAMPSDTPRVVFLDGEVIETDHRLRDGDTVSFVSPMGGG